MNDNCERTERDFHGEGVDFSRDCRKAEEVTIARIRELEEECDSAERVLGPEVVSKSDRLSVSMDAEDEEIGRSMRQRNAREINDLTAALELAFYEEAEGK